VTLAWNRREEAVVDEKRMAQLEAKARAFGLSTREAGELGRLYAEAEGKRYSDAATEHAARVKADRMAAERRRRRAWRRRRPGLFAGSRRLEVGTAVVPAEKAEHEHDGTPEGREERRAA
jgi:hypothetical protein